MYTNKNKIKKVNKGFTKKHKGFTKNLTRRQKFSGGHVPRPIQDFTVKTKSDKKESDKKEKLVFILDKTSFSETLPIQIPILIDERLFNKVLALNVDNLIEKTLIMNENLYLLEQKRKLGVSAHKEDNTIMVDSTPITDYTLLEKEPYMENSLLNPIYNKPVSTTAGGGAKYFKSEFSSNNDNWNDMLDKFVSFEKLFGENSTEFRDSVIERFNLYLEMISYCHHLTDMYTNYNEEQQKYLTDSLKKHNNERGIVNRFIQFLKEIKTRKSAFFKNRDEHFVSFVIFNKSVNALFSWNGEIKDDDHDIQNVDVNIFQFVQLADDATNINTDLTSSMRLTMPFTNITGMKPNSFYNQFKTYEWTFKNISEIYFKDTRDTGDNKSVLIRSTILYVILEMFNHNNIKDKIITNKIDNYKVLFSLLKENNHPNVDEEFLLHISKGFISENKKVMTSEKTFLGVTGLFFDAMGPGLIDDTDDEDDYVEEEVESPTFAPMYQKLLNLMTASTSTNRVNSVSLPINVFINLYRRTNTDIYCTTISDNVINDNALTLVNELEEYLTFNKYMNDTAIANINQITLERQTQEGQPPAPTKNIYNTLLDRTPANINQDQKYTNIEYISVTNIRNPKALTTQINDFEDFTQKLNLNKISANLSVSNLKVRTDPIHFKNTLEKSVSVFNSRCCMIETKIKEFGNKPEPTLDSGLDNLTIDTQRACLMSQLVYENTKVVRLFDFKDCWGREETVTNDGKGLKYLAAYQPDYQYGVYKNSMNNTDIGINRFNNEPYKRNVKTDNVQLLNYNYVQHKCHVWIDDNLKRVYVVFRGTMSGHDWYYTDTAISKGFGFQEGRLIQIKEILRDIYRQLHGEARDSYKLIFAGHSLGGFLSIMSAAVVYNNKVFAYKNTFKEATSITFNPWFPPELFWTNQGNLDYYFPIINYGTTCAFAYGVCGDAAGTTIIASCTGKNESTSACTNISRGDIYKDKIKGPFYYFMIDTWASADYLRNIAARHSVHNFYGSQIQKKILDASTDYSSVYNEKPENINEKNIPNIDMVVNQLMNQLKNTTTNKQPIVKINTNIVLSGNYRMPKSDMIINPPINIKINKNYSDTDVIVNI